MEQNEAITAKFLDDKEFRGAVSRYLLKQVYEQITRRGACRLTAEASAGRRPRAQGAAFVFCGHHQWSGCGIKAEPPMPFKLSLLESQPWPRRRQGAGSHGRLPS